MAIKGAFGAGFARGFADDFVGRIDARTEKQDKYMDLMIENARAKAPKYAAYKAQQTQLDSLGKQLQTDFNLTKAEVEFLKGKGALQDFHKTVYEQRNAAEAVNQTYNFDKNLFFAAMNLEDRTIPMNTADRLAVAGKAYNESVSGSKNPKSETTKVNSAKNALAKLLAFNPRLSAEQAVRAMEVAGYSADELMDWDPNAPRQDLYSDIALPTTAIPVVEFTAGENKTVINESGTKLRRLIGIEDVNGNPLNYATGDVLAANAPKNKKTLELAALTEEGANTFAQINKRLAYQGLGNPQQLNVLSNRYSALSYFRSKIDTEQELRFLIDAEKKGLVTEFLLENPMPTDQQLDDFFSQNAENANTNLPETGAAKSETPKVVTSVDAQTEAAVTANQQAAITEMPNGNAVARMLAEQGVTSESLTDDDMGLPDGPVNFGLTDIGMDRREAAYEDDTVEPLLSADVTDALISGQAFGESVSGVTNVVGDTVAAAPFKAVAAISDAVAYAADFVAGAMGAQSQTPGSKRLRESANQRRKTASEIAAKGWLSSMGISSPESVEAVAEGFRNTVFTEDGVKTENGLMTYEDFAKASSRRQENVEPRFIRKGMQITLNPDFVEPDEAVSEVVTDTKSEEDIVLEAAMVEIDEQTKRIKDMDRQFLADEKNYPQPLKAMVSIDPVSINTPAELDAAIAERVGEMPPDYKKQVVSAVASINKMVKDFEEKVNITAGTVIDTVSPSNLAESISNLTARIFDATLEERIMKNEGQRNRAAALAKLQEQWAALTLFPERTPVDIKDIDPYPTMAEMASEGLHSTQDKINASIASTAKAFLAKLGIGNSSEEGETKAEPLVARPKKAEKPKEMTSSDKARLRRAQKADKLSGDTSLLEMLVNKYGIALVQKEMGL